MIVIFTFCFLSIFAKNFDHDPDQCTDIDEHFDKIECENIAGFEFSVRV